MYRQTHQSNTPLGTSPGVLQQDLAYAQSDMYRRPTVFVSQAPYQNYNRVVPPPAHNGSNRQVNYLCRSSSSFFFKFDNSEQFSQINYCYLFMFMFRCCRRIIHCPLIFNFRHSIVNLAH